MSWSQEKFGSGVYKLFILILLTLTSFSLEAEELISFQNPSACSEKRICHWATKTYDDGKVAWYVRDDYKSFVALAKSRNYKCGVTASNGKLPQCDSSYFHNCIGVYEWNEGDNNA